MRKTAMPEQTVVFYAERKPDDIRVGNYRAHRRYQPKPNGNRL